MLKKSGIGRYLNKIMDYSPLNMLLEFLREITRNYNYLKSHSLEKKYAM